MTWSRPPSCAVLAATWVVLGLASCSAGSSPDQPVEPAPSTAPSRSSSTPAAPADAGTPAVRPPAHDAAEIARTAFAGHRHVDVVYDIRPADAKTDRWAIDVACSTSKGAPHVARAQYRVGLLGDATHADLRVVASGEVECTSSREEVTGPHLRGRGVQIDIATGSERVGSYYGLVRAAD